jgi:hypothetical protein
MEKLNADNLADAIKLLLIFISALLASLKGWDIYTKGEIKKKEIDAKENSLGKEALVLLKQEIILLRNEIQDLQKAKGENNLRVERLESIIKQMEMTYEFIEKRMLNMFPK